MTVRSVSGLAFVLVFLSAVLAQPAKPGGDDKKPSKDDKAEAPKSYPPFKDGRLDNENDKLTPQEQNEVGKLVRGQEDAPTGERRKAVMEKAARWYIYRLTSTEAQEGRDPNGSISQIMEEVLGGPNGIPAGRLGFAISKQPNPDAEERARRSRQWGAIEAFRPIAIAHVEKVLELNPPIARINALRMLHRLAEISLEGKWNEEVAEVFIRTIENPHEHDAVRVWAFHGIGALFDRLATPLDGVAIKVKDPRRLDRALLAICTWLNSRMKMDAAYLSQLSDPEKNAISYVRRVAVRALGNARRPLVQDDKGAREGPVAQLLVRLIETDEKNLASPPPTWNESVEAALALCKLQPKLSPSYQADYAVFQMARFIAQLGEAANADVTRENPLWRSYGLQLQVALEGLRTEVPAERGGSYVKSAEAQMQNVLVNLIDNTKNRQAAQELFGWTNGNAPKSTAVYNPPLP
jgi:hypothetical protein